MLFRQTKKEAVKHFILQCANKNLIYDLFTATFVS